MRDVLNGLHELLPNSSNYSLTCFIYFLFGKYVQEWPHFVCFLDLLRYRMLMVGEVCYLRY